MHTVQPLDFPQFLRYLAARPLRYRITLPNAPGALVIGSLATFISVHALALETPAEPLTLGSTVQPTERTS
jgi:hypothetical protein